MEKVYAANKDVYSNIIWEVQSQMFMVIDSENCYLPEQYLIRTLNK